MRLIVLALFALAVAGCAHQSQVAEHPLASRLQVKVSPSPEGHDWRLRTTLTAHGDQVRGIRAQRLDPDWCKVDEITAEAFPASVRNGRGGLTSLLSYGGKFSVTESFGGRRLEVMVGVYKSCAGQDGTFFLVLDKEQPASSNGRILQIEKLAWDPAVVFHLEADPARSVVYVRVCYACDHSGEWRWNPETSKFERQPEPEFG